MHSMGKNIRTVFQWEGFGMCFLLQRKCDHKIRYKIIWDIIL